MAQPAASDAAPVITMHSLVFFLMSIILCLIMIVSSRFSCIFIKTFGVRDCTVTGKFLSKYDANSLRLTIRRVGRFRA